MMDSIELLKKITVLEAQRIKAINEDGADVLEYDEKHEAEISAFCVVSFYLERPSFYDFRDFPKFLKSVLEENSIFFNDRRCFSYLFDVMGERLNEFGVKVKRGKKND